MTELLVLMGLDEPEVDVEVWLAEQSHDLELDVTIFPKKESVSCGAYRRQ